MTIESIDYVGGSEMIFSIRTAASSGRSAARLPVSAGLRNAR